MLKRGDKVSMMGFVRWDQEADDKHVTIEIGSTTVYRLQADLTLVQMHVEPGDPVFIKGDDTHGKWTVLAVDGDDAWVKGEGGNSQVEAVADLERWVEATVPAEAPAAEPVPYVQQLSSGKFYRTASGLKLGPAVLEQRNGWSLGGSHMLVHRDDGTYAGAERDMDIVAEWTDEPVDTPI